MGEYVVLLASIQASLYPKKFSCYHCKTEYGKSQRLIEKTIRKRKIRGCFDYKTKQYRIENIKYFSCVGNYRINIDFIATQFHKYEQNMLPFEGKLQDQPNKIIEIFDLFRQQINEYQKRELENGK